jgi:hypothetical protein
MAKQSERKNVGGRPSIYKPKDPACRVHGLMTTSGGAVFEQARKRVGEKHGVERPSDGDVVEFLAKYWGSH